MSAIASKMLTKIFGSRNDRLLKRYRVIVQQINEREAQVQALSDEQLRARTLEIRQGIKAGKIAAADVLPEAFAIIREAMDRNIGIRNIFNPEEDPMTPRFDPDRLDDGMLQVYDQVQQRMISSGEPWQTVPIPTELYAAIRKLYPESRPPFRARCFDVQLIGGLVLYEGKIAEMATGEGKTFVAPLACFMKVLEGFHTHVVTVNDYLVRRDALWVKPAFEQLGISVGYIQSDLEPGGDNRRRSYECDITYGTNSEFGFDYLRDNMKERVEMQVQGPLDFAIVDEVDSILIDEARTPLIISGAAHDDAPKYRAADAVARKVIDLHKPFGAIESQIDAAKRAIKTAEGDEDRAKEKTEKEAARQRRSDAEKKLADAEKSKEGVTQYYEVEWDRKSVHLTHEGIAAAQDAAGVGSFYVGNNMEWPHLMEQSLRAHVVYERDKDYVVERNPRSGEMEVVIVDEYTGRKMVGRQWSDGLHQAVEAKERVPIKQETQTLATITLQNFFKLYKSLSGMTGTAQTEAEEFNKIYRLEVVTIPTNRTVVRSDNDDRVYRTEREKWESIIDEIKAESDKGRPVLVGTTSVEKSEMVSQRLTQKYGVKHEVLNAKQHEREAHIVALAGQQHKNPHGEQAGNVTIATNMAGRGTDIKLSAEAFKAGGLHVIGTERHTARRIDNQLRGRSGRQGDPGSSRFYVSLQDDLMKMFAGEWTVRVLSWLGMEEGEHIEDKRISKGILRAQKKVEERNFLARKNLLDYDEVMDHQRTTFYGMRQRVLEGRDVDEVIWEMIGESIADAVSKYITKDYVAANIAEWARTNFEVNLEADDLSGMRRMLDLEDYLKGQARVEAEGQIGQTLAEFMGEEMSDDAADWDTKGLSSWAMSRFQVNLPQAQIKKMTAKQLEERLKDAALEQIDKRDVSVLSRFLEPLFAERELAAWAKEKFDVEVAPEEFLVGGIRQDAERPIRKTSDEIEALIEDRARQAYAQREVEYPVDHMLTYVSGGEQSGAIENPYAADIVRQWTLGKFGVEMSLEQVQAMPIRQLREDLVKHQHQAIRSGKLEKEIEAMAAAHPQSAALADAFNRRYPVNRKISAAELDNRAETRLKGEPAHDADMTPVELLTRRARRILRQELTDLEQFVLIQIFDQSWKDHLYAMDMLKAGVGLSGFAERDPRIVYKKEGYRYFQEMMAGVRDKVTDLIFRARVVGQTQTRSNYRETAAVHEAPGSYGVSENLQEVPAAAVSGEEAQAGGEAEAVAVAKPIVNEAPKVGRNDPCPCGSGKKYKKCCGVNAA